ncbi:RNA-guided endonuclease IscB [Endozoicomonas sp. 4G]|uniref:RNA-guided endonuclease IscB n=1 Tax=Endozoicomonas sp. 4G TaxID=2872754 RepID=UPI00207913BD|nr:RNA-guided endonuclease IscB [Endozoicomonas sp. 4G]
MLVYVLNKNGEPLMPCKPQRARKLLKESKAKVVSRTPFTIQLQFGSTGYKQTVVTGMDTGSKVIGCAAISNGKVVYQSQVKLRTDIKKKMDQRRMYRSNRRNRKTRYRKPRFLNRKNSTMFGRLPPSVRSKVQSHFREKKQVEMILPVTRWNVETASFDIHKITNPEVSGRGYQEGKQKDYYNVKAYVLDRDGYKCHSKQKVKHSEKLHVHHIVFRSNGGTDEPGNLITLCERCHKDLHDGKFEIKGQKSKTKHATQVSIIKEVLKKNWSFKETFGYETKFKRETILKLPKTHFNDAVAICCEHGELVKPSPVLYQKVHVSKGDYQLHKGQRSEKKIPVGKLFGIKKFDYVNTQKGKGFIKGRMSTGYAVLMDIEGKTTITSTTIKKGCKRLSARSTTLIDFKHCA